MRWTTLDDVLTQLQVLRANGVDLAQVNIIPDYDGIDLWVNETRIGYFSPDDSTAIHKYPNAEWPRLEADEFNETTKYEDDFTDCDVNRSGWGSAGSLDS